MEIHPISPDRVEDYFALFDNAFGDNPRWAGCYCAFYDDPRPDEEWDTEGEGFAEANRAFRRDHILAGRAFGLLAYDGAQPVGWLNAAPRGSYGNLRVFAASVEEDDPPIGSIMCFVIHPDHRGKGVATALLDASAQYLRDQGMTMAEAYPRKTPPSVPGFPWTAAYYKGTPEMFESAGFATHREHEYFISMRKML